MLLEVIVLTLEDARAAAAGGADRLEVVREIERDGLTPSAGLVRAIQAETNVPLRVMVRESDGFSIAGPAELATLQRAMETFAQLGVDGAVVGFARGGRLDVETLQQVLSAAPGLPVTLHRAFDHVDDRLAALDAVRPIAQVDRVLTDGGGGDWSLRSQRLQEYAARAAGRLTILAGGGLDEAGLRVLARTQAVREAHVGKAAREPRHSTAPVSADRVRYLKEICGGASAPP
jgi:copper homeostasis protein